MYKTFIGALTDTVSHINSEDTVFHAINSFTVVEREDHTFLVSGEAWSFVMFREGEGWSIRGE